MPPQRIMIIGGASGIGAALTISIVTTSPDALVFMMDRSIEYSSSGPLAALLSYPNRMYGHEADVTDPTQREKAVALCASDEVLGGIDTLVYCAGVIEPISRIESLALDDMRYTYEVNVFGVVAMV